MKIAILSAFHPFRGGISQFNASIFTELGREHDVRAFNFTTQYPGFLFPGKTQYTVPGDGTIKVDSVRILSTVNPLSWVRTARAIRNWGADLLIMRYWMSWFAPSLGWVARHAGKNCKVIAIADNIIPHEPHFFDKPLTSWFLKGADGCITLSSEVGEDLLKLRPGIPHTTIRHPSYDIFGSPVPRSEAEARIGVPPGSKTLLFFGLIRHYKGLDILLKAFEGLPQDYRLIVAGEPYGDFAPYQEIIDASPARDRIHLFTRYIPDEEVKYFFSAADVCVLPYRSATQSGVNAAALQLGVPMIVTDTGGLRADVEGRGTGLVAAEATPECVRATILEFFNTPGLPESCREHIAQERQQLSWPAFCKKLIGFSQTL